MKHILCMLSGIVGLALFFLFLQLERTSPALAYVLMGLCPTAVFLLCPYPGEYSARLGTGGRLALSVLACGVGSALRSISDISIEHGVIAHPFHLPIALLLLLALASAGLAAYFVATRLALPAFERSMQEDPADRQRAESAAYGQEQASAARPRRHEGPENPARFQELLIRILVQAAMVDGHFTRAEFSVILQFFRHKLGYDENRMVRVKQLAKQAMDYPADLEKLVEEFGEGFSYTAYLILLELVYALVYTKTPPLKGELEQAHAIAARLGVFAADLRNIRAKYRGQRPPPDDREEPRRKSGNQQRSQSSRPGSDWQGQDSQKPELPPAEAEALEILGLEPGASAASIKKAYRRLVLQYHPDKVAHLGAEFRHIAEEKTKEINVAYALLCKVRGA